MSCPRHKRCAYTGTEPGLCATCHASTAKCAGLHGRNPGDGSWRRGTAAGMTHGTLKPGQSMHPQETGSEKLTVRQPRLRRSELESVA
jgi:hypothetical protein